MNQKYLKPKNLRIVSAERNVSRTKNLAQVFELRRNSYINELNLFIILFNCVPNLLRENDINCKKASIWFASTYPAKINDKNPNKSFFYSADHNFLCIAINCHKLTRMLPFRVFVT